MSMATRPLLMPTTGIDTLASGFKVAVGRGSAYSRTCAQARS